MMAEKRLLQDIETGVVGETDTDEAKVRKLALISLSLQVYDHYHLIVMQSMADDDAGSQ